MMRRSFRTRAFFLGACALAVSCGRDAPDPSPTAPSAPEISAADLVIWGGMIHTGLERAPEAEAVAVLEGRIVFVGSRADAEVYVDETNSALIDLNGATLFPGFVDAHAHLFGIGERERRLDLADVGSIAEFVAAVEDAVGPARASGVTLTGRGWIESAWPDGRFPTRDDIDPVTGDTPTLLVRADGHALLANSAALAAAGINADTPDPDGGRIERDETGRATGLLIDNAMALAAALAQEPRGDARDDILADGAAVYAARGWTGIHNMSVEFDDVPRMERLAADGALPIRVYNAIDPTGFDRLLVTGPREAADGRVVTRAVKIYMDGALGSRGAALFEPYADAAGTTGLLLRREQETMALFDRALEHDIQLAIHAIGDRANHLVMNWIEVAYSERPMAASRARWRIEHAQVVHPDDISRFDALDLIASMQPSHFATDQYFAPARLGPDRLEGAYAWASILAEGALVAGGSDAPVERGDPAAEFHAAVARADLQGGRVSAFDASEAVTREQALAMFTRWPAFAAFQEDELGVIAVGMRADFTAFDRDLMTVELEEIPHARAVLTVVDGAVAFSALE